MALSSILTTLKSWAHRVRAYLLTLWTRYRGLSRTWQIVVAIVALVVLYVLLHAVFGGGAPSSEENSLPVVTTERVDSLAGGGSAVSVVGSVRSVKEAEILAQSGGTVIAIHTRLGAGVGAGGVIAELENASQRAAVLQAEGAYDAAVAARDAASPTDIAESARNTYNTAYTTLDTLLKLNIDTFFGQTGGQGPQLLVSPSPFDFAYFPKERQALTDEMATWRSHLATSASTDPQTLLDEAERITKDAVTLGNDLGVAATKNNSDATTAQLTALSTARSGFTNLQSSITAAKVAFQGQNTSATAGADASVKIALGSLRAAQAQLEKTLIRAPIAGTINFLPIHTGDYVAPLTHVATVAQNGALEIVAYISEASRAGITVNSKVVIEDSIQGVVTSIAPALDPVTKQIEIHVVPTTTSSTLVNGQSVRLGLPSDTGATATSHASSTPLFLPLTSLKLTPSARVIFSVGDDGRLVAHSVTIGEVHGDHIEITSPLPGDLEIITDARGFSEGEKVATSTTP